MEKRIIYVASSWRNEHQPSVVNHLRMQGHQVYDFRNPSPGDNGFSWSEIDPNWKNWDMEPFREALAHPIAQKGYEKDYNAMMQADTFVGVMPFGRSASIEMGWAAGNGKSTFLLWCHEEPELMIKMFDYICLSLEELDRAFEHQDKEFDLLEDTMFFTGETTP